MDDYEEGTFTPAIYGTTTTGAGTYTAQTGYYTKVGRAVNFQIILTWTGHTGAGSMRVSGLPFTSGTGLGIAVASIYSNNVVLTAGTIMTAYTADNTTIMVLLESPTGGGAVAGPAMDTAGQVGISGTYMT